VNIRNFSAVPFSVYNVDVLKCFLVKITFSKFEAAKNTKACIPKELAYKNFSTFKHIRIKDKIYTINKYTYLLHRTSPRPNICVSTHENYINLVKVNGRVLF